MLAKAQKFCVFGIFIEVKFEGGMKDFPNSDLFSKNLESPHENWRR
jgi:hypothetical protein